MDGWKTKKRTQSTIQTDGPGVFWPWNASALVAAVFPQNNRLAAGSLWSGLGLVQHAGCIEPWIWVRDRSQRRYSIPFHIVILWMPVLFNQAGALCYTSVWPDLSLRMFPPITSKLYRHTVKFGVVRSKLQTKPQVWGLAHCPATRALPRRSRLGRGERHCGRVFWMPQVPRHRPWVLGTMECFANHV